MVAIARTSTVRAPGRAPVCTPAPILATRRGQFPNLPYEILRRSTPHPLLLQCALTDWFCLNPNSGAFGEDLFRGIGSEVFLEGGLASFCHLPDAVLFLGARAAGTAEFVNNAPGKGCSVIANSPSHRHIISPGQVVRLHAALKTHFVEAPSDSPPLHAPSKRAIPRSVLRTDKLVEATLQEIPVGMQSPANAPFLFVPVHGGADSESRTMSAGMAATRCAEQEDVVAGFTLAGFYAGESAEQRWKCIRACVDNLPEGPLRVLAGHAGAPVEALEAVRCGVDLVESSYPFDMAAAGFALDIAGGTKVNCRDRAWERSKAPVLDGCGCFVCGCGGAVEEFYSRAYLRHLLEVHEMMGVTLLAAHNLYNYLEWFGELQSAVRDGRVDQFTQQFYDRREVLRLSLPRL